MKKITTNLFSVVFLLMTTVMFSQGKIKGTVLDSELNGGLPGVNIVVKGSTTGVSTDIDGKFILSTTASSGQVVVSYIGYKTQSVSFTVKSGETVDLGTIKLTSDASQLEEVVVKSSVIDIAKDRKTPVAVSTIKAMEIQQKLGNQEFPEILKNTPSVYTSKSGGGFGDSRVVIRGFDQKNIAVMINGVPVNDMENSAVYWSNWAGLSDVTSAMQVQRGLGSSKLAISSVGGTINVVTKTSDMKEGGVVSTTTANDNYLKVQGAYNTGLMKNGLSASFLISSTTGNGYVDGTKFEGKNYFLAFGYKPNEKHDFQFTFTGAPQWHNQRSSSIKISDYIKYGQNGEPNIKYNSDWGNLDGKEFNMKRNFYHKPVASFNWDYKINATTKLSAVVYGSWGRGGGSGGVGGIKSYNYLNAAFRNADGSVDFDKIYAFNSGQTVMINGVATTRTLTNGEYQNSSSTGSASNLSTGISRVSSFNSHDWYGGIVNLNKKLSSTLTLDFGFDGRIYKGIHFQNLNSTLGGDSYLDKSNVNNPSTGVVLTELYPVSPSLNPFASANVNEKIGYDYYSKVNWYGLFTQLEYSKDNLTAYVQGAVSQQAFKKVDNFTYLLSNPLSSTDYEKILGGNVKGGANYNINANHNVYVNAGYYSKQPFFNAVYPNNKSVVNGNLVNEKILGLEAGYGFTSRKLTAKLNLYHTQWKDRYQRSNDVATDNPGGYYDFSGITEIHSGVELEMFARVTDKFKLNGMFSVGNWDYKGNSTSNRYDASNNSISGGTSTTLYLDKVKVGNAAQLTAALGGSYEVLKRVTVDANYNYYDKLYANINPSNFGIEANKGSLQIPSYGLVDAGFSYKMLVGKDKSDSVNFRFNVNNLFDRIYIAESSTNIFADDIKSGTTTTYAAAGSVYKGVADANTVFFGFGRTWNFGVNYNF
jgi:hypothetical protein